MRSRIRTLLGINNRSTLLLIKLDWKVQLEICSHSWGSACFCPPPSTTLELDPFLHSAPHLLDAAEVVARTSHRVSRASAASASPSQLAPPLAPQRSMVSCGKTGRRGALVPFLLEKDGRAALPCPWGWCLRSLALRV